MATFPKRMRKLSPETLSALHQNGNVLFHHPFKIYYLMHSASDGCRSECNIVISVPKRNFKRAVDRNRIKRQIREAFRFHSNALNQELSHQNIYIDLLCLYLPHEHTTTAILIGKMDSLLSRLTERVALSGAPPAHRDD